MDVVSFSQLEKIIRDQFLLNLKSDHGISHWRSVEKIGIYLARKTGADVEIVRLFAILHDSQRECEGYDPDHGSRAAEYVQRLSKDGLLALDQLRLGRLMSACRYHNNRKTQSDDITTNICWDSDRIDLTRVGVQSNDIELVTEVAREYLWAFIT